MRRWITYLALAAALPTLAGCFVSKGKYRDLETEYASAQELAAQTIAARDARIDGLENELEAAQGEVDRLSRRERELEEQLDYTQEQLSNVMKDSESFRQSAEELEASLNETRRRKREAERRVAEFRNLIDRFRTLIDAGTLRVKIADGRMVIELQSDILFGSGSARLSEDGRKAIDEVAGVLIELADRRFQVEGHTDTDPIRNNERYKSNWELGMARALVVVETMLAKGMPAQRISAASFGEFRPAAPNDTPEGKAQNRRIEIVVVPDLSNLPGFEELQSVVNEQ